MKKLLSVLAVIICLCSCSRDPNSSSSPTLADGTVRYRVNGNLVTINNISLAAGEYTQFLKAFPRYWIPYTRYNFQALKGTNNNNNNILSFVIVLDSLTVGNYTYDSASSWVSLGFTPGVQYNGQHSIIIYKDDYISINITSYSNGYISGNLTAKLSPLLTLPDYSTRGTIVITEGEFKNIECIYL